MLQCREQLGELDLSVLQAHTAACTSPADVEGKVHICRISKAFEDGKARLQLSVAPPLQNVLQCVCRSLTVLGGVAKFGPLPRSQNERRVAAMLFKHPEP